MSFLANYGALGSERSMVASAWNLTEVAARYEHFIDEFGELAPASPDEVLRAQTMLVHEWRRFPFLDPQLPGDLLPPRWSGTTATALFTNRHMRWRTPAQTRWTELAKD
jgi:phenylacetic acid degradation operon negative regulatory protein